MERARSIATGLRGHISRLEVLVCLLLVGFLLYNPFLSLVYSPNGLSLDHLPRNRATVGAGEMQHFSPVTKGFPAAGSAAVGNGKIVPVLQEKEFPLAADDSPYPFVLSDYSSNLWFRPPPSP